MRLSLAALADRLGGRPHGAADACVERLALLDRAGEGDLSPVPGERDLGRARHSGATALLLPLAADAEWDRPAILVENPLLACARAAQWLPPAQRIDAAEPVVDPGATLAASVELGRGVRIGAGSRIGPWTSLGDGAVVGDYCEIGARVSIGREVRIGNRVRIGSGSCLGEAGFALLRDGPVWIRFPGLGGLRVADDAEIGANVTIDRGALGDTLVGRRVRLDNQVHIGHDSRIGDDTVMAGRASVAGGVRLGRGCVIGGAAAVADGLQLADGVTVGAMSLVTKAIDAPGARYCATWPARPARAWWRWVATIAGKSSR